MDTKRNGCTDIIEFKDFDDFYKHVLDIHGDYYEKFNSLGRKNFIFRGHSSDKYLLIPKVLRESEMNYLSKVGLSNSGKNPHYNLIQMEKNLLIQFYGIANNISLPVPDIQLLKINLDKEDLEDYNKKWIDCNFFQLATLAQHYGIYTRLLDWTLELLI